MKNTGLIGKFDYMPRHAGEKDEAVAGGQALHEKNMMYNMYIYKDPKKRGRHVVEEMLGGGFFHV